MALTDKQLDLLNKHFEEKKIVVKCTLCQSMDLSTGEMCISPILQGKNINLGGPIVPMIQLICNNCGNIMHLAALPVLGQGLGE